MSFPWVSRELYESVCAERDRLRIQVDSLISHRGRLERAENGMSEVPRDPRKPIDQPPKELREYIKGFAFKLTRQMIWAEAKKRRMTGQTWEDIVASIKARPASLPEQELEPELELEPDHAYEEDDYDDPENEG